MKNPLYRITVRPFAAAVVYTAFAIYLYHPYLQRFKPIQYFVLLNPMAGALGCYVLSRRWINSFYGSLFAGAVYGFCPLAFGFAAFHPLAGAPLALMPWLFSPAAYYQSRSKINLFTATVTASLSLLPFIVIAAAFWLCAQTTFGPFFPLPKTEKLHFAELLSLAVPLSMDPRNFIFSFYHVPLAAGLMGLFMYFASGRIWMTIIAAAGFCLAFFDSVFQVSPIVWSLVGVLFCSVLIGLGMQGLAYAGRADKRWVLACAIIIAALAVATRLLGHQQEAKLHGLGALILVVMFLISQAGLRLHMLRWTLLCVGIGLDLVLGARYIVDKIF